MSSRAFRLAVKLLLLPLARAALHEAVAEDCGASAQLGSWVLVGELPLGCRSRVFQTVWNQDLNLHRKAMVSWQWPTGGVGVTA